jgi:2,3-bisphosphoglycerate-dependent phosphoglycerate mutase
MQTLILARHGESTYSARGLVNGDPAVGVGLTPRGEEEARALGGALADEPLELCVVTALPRTRATAELALVGREVPIEEAHELGDPRAGCFEGCELAEYRAWAWSHGSQDEPPGGGESRRTVVARYARAYRALLERPQRTVLAVVHGLPIAYVLLALDGVPPPPRVDLEVEYARPYPIFEAELRRALGVLEDWQREPTW